MSCSEAEKSRYQKWYYKHHERNKELKRQSMKKRRDENPEPFREQSRRAKAKLREKIFDTYGHTCARCGFDDKRALTLDHKLNNGAQERKDLGERGVYYRAIEEHRPDEYQILCMNCQFIKRCEDLNQNQH